MNALTGQKTFGSSDTSEEDDEEEGASGVSSLATASASDLRKACIVMIKGMDMAG